MATATPPAVQNAPKTPTPKSYDPVQTVAGMFSGSIMRLAYVLQDPKNYSESTKIILAECTKKYQDALDDCQIQILDAKWYLERKLAENKARREAEAKAREANTAPAPAPAPAKRKHDEVDDISRQQQQQQQPQPEGTPTKRARSSEQPSPTSAAAVANLSTTKYQPKPAETTQQLSQPASTSPAQTMAPSQSQPQSKEPPKPVESEKVQTAEPEKKQPEPESQQDHFNTDDFMKPTPQTTPALTNDEFNFESMFEGPLEDNNDAIDNDELGMNFNMDDTPAQFTQDETNMNSISASNTQTNTQPQQQQQQQQPQSQPQEPSGGPIPLLQGLEQFANPPDQCESQNSTTNLTSQPMQNQPSNISNTSNPFTSNEPNIWDSMLADETMNFDNAEFENMESMGNIDTTKSNPDDFGNMNMNMNMDGGDPNWDDMF